MYRRLASTKVSSRGNSHIEHAPNAYEMSSGKDSQNTHTNVQSEAGAPATSTKPVVTNAADNDRAGPSAPPPQITSDNDTILIDNDLYE